MKKPVEISPRQLTYALSMVPGLGDKAVARVTTRNELIGTKPHEFLALSPEALREDYRFGLKPAALWHDHKEEYLKTAAESLQLLDSFGVVFATPVEPHYPEALTEFHPDPPGLLFFYGNHNLVKRPTFGIFSSRKTSRAGLEAIDKAAEEGVLNGEVLVSGHDTPEYQRSAIAPLRWGAPRILVLTRGFFQALGPELKSEPFRAARLWRFQFDPTVDLVISAVGPLSTSHRNANRERDALAASLCRRLDFVEVAPKGNMEMLVKQGIASGRKVRVGDMSENARQYFALGASALPMS